MFMNVINVKMDIMYNKVTVINNQNHKFNFVNNIKIHKFVNNVNKDTF